MLRYVLLAILAFACLTTPASVTSPYAKEAKKFKYIGDVYLLRGFAGVFSRGLDKMGDQLIEKGVDARVIAHSGWKEATNEIIRNRKKYGKRPVVLIGHSLGANAIIRMATHLKKARIRVDYMASFAATDPDPVPTNVRKFTNYYFKTDGWGDEISAAKGFRGQLKNIDFSKDKQVGHFNIDKQPRLQRQVINNVMRFVRKKKATSRAAAKQTSDNG